MSRLNKYGFIGLVLVCLCGKTVQAGVFGDFTYTDYGTYIEITKYSGSSANLVIPEAINGKPVTSIDRSSSKVDWFASPLSVNSILLPSSLTTIGKYVFTTSDNLVSFDVNPSSAVFSAENGVLFNKSKTKIVRYPPGGALSYQIPAGVTDIGEYAFYDNRELTNVVFTSSVTNIEYYAFGYCYALASPILPPDLTRIEARSFYSCQSFTDLNIPSNVSSIGEYAFGRCNALVDVTIPSTVTTLEQKVFWMSAGLTSVTFENGVLSIGDNAFQGCENLLYAYFLGDAPSMGTDVFIDNATGFSIYYLADKTGFDSSPLNGYPSIEATLPPAFTSGSEPDYEVWVLTNVVAWGEGDFSAIPAADFEKAWLVNTMPIENMNSVVEFCVGAFSIESNQISMTLGLDVKGLPKAGAINGWLAIKGKVSLTTNEWHTAGGQTVDQNKVSFDNGEATVVFDCPDGACFFMPTLQKDIPTGEVTVEVQ